MINTKLLILLNKICNKFRTNDKIKKQFIWIIILISALIGINEYKLCILLNNIIVIAIIVSFTYVSLICRIFVDKNFKKKIEVIDLVSITMIILNILGIKFLLEESFGYYFFILYNLQVSLECCQIENIFKFKRNTLKTILVFLSYGITLMSISIILNRYSKIFMMNKSILILLVTSLISFCIAISTLVSVYKNIDCCSKVKFKKILFYMISIVFNYIILISLLMNDGKFTVIAIIIKCVTFYKFYDYIIRELINSSLKKMNKNIKLTTKTKKELNSILIKRNTILKETNTMIQKSQYKYNELIDSIYAGILLFYGDELQYINKRALEVLNIEKQEILGISLEETISRYLDVNLQDIEKTQNYIPCAKIKNANFEVEIFLIEIDDGVKLFYAHNITEVNKNKKIIKEMEEYLKEDELKKKFFANISHELKTPINLIFSALQVNKLYLEQKNINGIKKNINIIKQNSLRLIRTINNFIDANKLSEGYIIPEYKIYNIVEIVENVSISCNKYIKLIENTLTFDADDEEIYVNCDKEMITRVILNILSNSVKYGKRKGNIKVNICIENNNYVTIRVKNDGMKIDEKTIPYIFDKFTKLNKAFNRIKEGSGLGMFLTKGLIELQGGRIKLITNNYGNEFIITMPRVKDVKAISMHEELGMNPLEEKVDIEFSDIYIE